MLLSEEEFIDSDIHELLQSLGLTANYKGYYYVAYAIQLIMQEPQRLLMVTKWLYPDIAAHYKTLWPNVERGIRTVIIIIWNNHPEVLSHYAGYELKKKPCSAQFLSILASYYKHSQSQTSAGHQSDDLWMFFYLSYSNSLPH